MGLWSVLGGSSSGAFDVGASVDVASLELVAGFGARVGRQNARKEDVAAEHGLRFLRCRIPKKHPLREQHKMTPAQRYLDL